MIKINSSIEPKADLDQSEQLVSQDTANKTMQKIADRPPKEVNGPRGLEPTRYGDWESKGRCYDF